MMPQSFWIAALSFTISALMIISALTWWLAQMPLIPLH
jgi:hypothetical protein